MKKILLIVLVLILLGGYLYYRNLVSGPQYALLQAKEAAQNHNLPEFEKYVNIESVTGNLVDQVLDQEELMSEFIPGLSIAQGALIYLKPALASAARTEVRNYIETGRININPGNQSFLSLAAVVGAIVSDDSQFKSIAYVKEKGEEALVGLEFTQPKYDTTLVVEIKMQDKGDHWQATELTNTGKLLQRVAHLEKQRLMRR